MKILYFLRHAKSSWKDETLPDHDRPLAKRGNKAAPRMATTLSEQKYSPELILSSTALRAVQTATLIRQTGFEEIPCQKDERLYASDPGVILSVIHEQSDEYGVLLLVGHNPEFENLVCRLSVKGEYIRMPTAALVGLEFPVDSWKEIELGQGSVSIIAYPVRK